MSRVLHRPRADEALIPCATARPVVAERPRAVAAPRPHRRPGVSVEVLADLHGADRPAPPSKVLLAIALAAAPQDDTDWSAQLAADWAAVDERWDNLAAQTATVADEFVLEQHFYGQLKLGALEELIEDLSDDLCYVMGVFDAEAADVQELIDAELAVAL